MKFSLNKVDAWAASKPPGAREELLAAGTLRGDVLELTPEAFVVLWGKYGGEKPLPAMTRRLKNAAGAVVRNTKQAVTGKDLYVTPMIEAARSLICTGTLGGAVLPGGACPQYRPSDDHCAKCGCKLSGQLKGKLRLKAERCPENKW